MNEGEYKGENLFRKKRFRLKKNPKQRKTKRRKQKKRQSQMNVNFRPHLMPLRHMPVRCAPYAQSFWNNYRSAMEWSSSYMQTYWKRRAIDLHQENIMLKHKLSIALNETFEHQDIEYQVSNENQTEEVSEDWCYEQQDDNSDTHSEFELSEEFLKFIETSYKHKESMKKNNEREKKGWHGEFESSAQKDYKSFAPAEDTGAIRSSEMKELYGRDSAKIHGMETAMHLGFLLKCDKNKPVVWPVLPLSHSYSSSSHL